MSVDPSPGLGERPEPGGHFGDRQVMSPSLGLDMKVNTVGHLMTQRRRQRLPVSEHCLIPLMQDC